MKDLEYNTVDITIVYATNHEDSLTKVYTVAYNPDTGVQQYLDYYQEGFIHDHAEAVKMEITTIKAYNNEQPDKTSVLYKSEGKHRWAKNER